MNKYNCELNLNDRNSLSLLLQRIEPNSVVLEFGPANGRMTKYMKEQLKCKVYAVEIDENAAKDSEKYTEKIVVDSIENYSWQKEFENIKFDYIVFADVLEHLYYPQKVLESVKGFLAENGSILVSIPNIAHNTVVLGLLKNEFNYSPTGLLDDTHIRFYTKKTFDKLIEKSGYFKSYETAVFLPPESTEFSNNYDDFSEEIANHLSEKSWGEIYQLIYEFKLTATDLVSELDEKYKNYSKYFIQLFIEDKNGLSEENSIKLPVLQNNEIQKFEFDLKDKKNIQNLRLDPLNDSCVIEIQSIKIVTNNEENELIECISSNSIINHGKNYFFDIEDPNIYFEGTDTFQNTDKLIVAIRFVHIGKDALHVSVKQTKTELDQTKTELEKIYISKSWKITKPLRSIFEITRKLIKVK